MSTSTSTPTACVFEIPGVRALGSRESRELVRAQQKAPTTEQFLTGVLGPLGTVHALSRNAIDGGATYPSNGKGSTVGLLFQSTYGAFNFHQKLALRPEVLWYAVMHEVARYVKGNAADCAHLFNGDPENKKVLSVRDDSLHYGDLDNDWGATIGSFRPLLTEQIPSDVLQNFLPPFSTLGEEEAVALLATFMDVASSYYRYQVHTLCGIPAIRLDGTAEDWVLLAESARMLSSMFEGLRVYFSALIPVLCKIADAVQQGNGTDLWKSIFKFESVSGGANVTGWITALVAYVPDRDGTLRMRKDCASAINTVDCWKGLSAGDFPSHVSSADVLWNYYGEDHALKLVSGVLGVENDGFLCPRLGWGLIEPPQRA